MDTEIIALIDPMGVEKTFNYCIFRNTSPEAFVKVEGIQKEFFFNPERLEEKRTEIIEWLKLLPHRFRKNETDGGWTFLMAGKQEDGHEWSNSQKRTEKLLLMGMALGIVDYLLHRALWNNLVGKMPYYVIDV